MGPDRRALGPTYTLRGTRLLARLLTLGLVPGRGSSPEPAYSDEKKRDPHHHAQQGGAFDPTLRDPHEREEEAEHREPDDDSVEGPREVLIQSDALGRSAPSRILKPCVAGFCSLRRVMGNPSGFVDCQDRLTPARIVDHIVRDALGEGTKDGCE